MDLTIYRNSASEKARSDSLLALMPSHGQHALDIGAREGYFSLLMAQRFSRVTALDLTTPNISHPRISCVAGDVARLPFPADSFDLVLCAEVLEHVQEEHLASACLEIQRVSASHVLLGVPNEQDIRVGRTTCAKCGRPNPPWGHVNAFDRARLRALFPGCEEVSVDYVGERREGTNRLSTLLMDFSGNPYGTYDQEEPCVHCGLALGGPARRSLSQRVATRLGYLARLATEARLAARPNWIHLLLRKKRAWNLRD